MGQAEQSGARQKRAFQAAPSKTSLGVCRSAGADDLRSFLRDGLNQGNITMPSELMFTSAIIVAYLALYCGALFLRNASGRAAFHFLVASMVAVTASIFISKMDMAICDGEFCVFLLLVSAQLVTSILVSKYLGLDIFFAVMPVTFAIIATSIFFVAIIVLVFPSALCLVSAFGFWLFPFKENQRANRERNQPATDSE